MIASVLKHPTMIVVTLLCGRVLSERALHLLFLFDLTRLREKSALTRKRHDPSCEINV